jgi:bacteriorhodopsin
MATFISKIAPRIIIPGFFVARAATKAVSMGDLLQNTAFSFFFASAVLTVFQNETPWLALIPGIACIAYYKMMSDKANIERYRYSDWVLTTPLMLVAIFTAGRLPLLTILLLVVLDIEMIAAGYFGIQEKKRQFPFFLLGMIAFLPIVYFLLMQKTNGYVIAMTVLVWSAYPLVYYLNETRTIAQDTTISAYAIMDMVAKIGLVSYLKF